MFKRIILLLIVLLTIPQAFADIKVSTIAEVDPYGTAKIQHIFQEPLENVDLNVYSPESLDTGDAKFSISNDVIHLSNVKKGTRVIYFSDTFAKKEGEWIIKYGSLNPESFKLVLPFSAQVKEVTGNNVRSKDRSGQVIEWNPANDVKAVYRVTSGTTYNFRWPFLILLAVFLIVLIYWRLTKKPVEAEYFLQLVRGIKRPVVKRVIYAILVLAYEHQDKLMDQSKIRGIMRDEDFEANKSEVHGVVNRELDWLIDRNESKITVKRSAEKKYELTKNAKKIIKLMKKENLIEKPENGK